ncbi:MAG: imidazoleglycerol-phosphate dehydratase HisB [Nitrospirae bacterium]|nr:imidazoleglycerol-phosphate dehydratase HisB [Nitrospirota bacterium]
MRASKIERKTKETDIVVSVNLDGNGTYAIRTSIPFLDHMLSLMSKHGLFDIKIKAKGDREIDDHHTVEDIGIVLGKAFKKALGDMKGISRYGYASVPMNSGITLHVSTPYGRNTHHIIEGVFKAFGRALKQSVAIDPRVKGVPSTKKLIG